MKDQSLEKYLACISLYEGKASPRVETVLHKQNVCEMEAEKNEMKTLCYIRPLSFFSHLLFLSEVRSVSLTKKSRCQDNSVQHLFEKLLLEKKIKGNYTRSRILEKPHEPGSHPFSSAVVPGGSLHDTEVIAECSSALRMASGHPQVSWTISSPLWPT